MLPLYERVRASYATRSVHCKSPLEAEPVAARVHFPPRQRNWTAPATKSTRRRLGLESKNSSVFEPGIDLNNAE